MEYFWEKNMKILELVKNLFRYPVDMEEKIIQHEEKMLKVYTQILYLIFDYPHKHYTFKYFEV